MCSRNLHSDDRVVEEEEWACERVSGQSYGKPRHSPTRHSQPASPHHQPYSKPRAPSPPDSASQETVFYIIKNLALLDLKGGIFQVSNFSNYLLFDVIYLFLVHIFLN